MADLETPVRERRGACGSVRTTGAGLSVLALASMCAAFAGTAAAAAPVRGSVSGPVIAVKGSTFKLTTSLSPTGTSTVTVSKTTVISAQKTLAHTSLKAGACVMATGAKNAKGVVAAARITLSAPVKGQCTSGFTRRGPRPAGSGRRPPSSGGGSRPGGGFRNFANFGFAFGKIATLKGAVLTVKGTTGSKAVTTTVTVTAKTQVEKTVRVNDASISLKACVFVRGTSSDKGVTIKAQDIALSQPTATGCRFGFGGR
ncbi:MAG TPA: hypothetical protein VMU58_08125 [Gaiellaceae bacterium]|nr:hypothetical protein [Gaiellaceae bacterium]